MILQLVRPQRRVIVRRAVFVCDHPDLGLVVIDRSSKFQRSWRPNLDECKTKGVLIDQARKALRTVFGGDIMEMDRVAMISTSNQEGVVIEHTIFRISTIFGGVYKNLPEDTFMSVDDHELGAAMRHALSAKPPKERIRRIG